MKRKYMKPQVEVVKIQQTQMLCGSPKPDATDYNDWLGAPEFNFDGLLDEYEHQNH